jgi:hypothetical protein
MTPRLSSSSLPERRTRLLRAIRPPLDGTATDRAPHPGAQDAHPPLRRSPYRCISSLAFARASARCCARDLGGSIDGGWELVRESCRACNITITRPKRSHRVRLRLRLFPTWVYLHRPLCDEVV